MRKAVIAGIGITLIIFSFLIVYAQPPVLPIQVFGAITPTLPDGHVIYFKIDDLDYASTNIADSQYGQDPILFLPADDLGTPDDKEGYSAAEEDIVEIYIDSVKVKEVSNLTYPYEEINIGLTTSQYDNIVGVSPPAPQTTTPPRRGGGGGCFYRWNCSEWGPCQPNGTQSRLCLNSGTCRPRNKTFSQECTYVPPPKPKVEPEKPKPEKPKEIPKPKKSLAWLLYTIIIIVVAGGLAFVIYEKERSHKALRQEMKQPKLDQKSHENLKDYIKNTLEMGYTRDQIRRELLMEGWSPQILRQVFAEVK